MESSNMVEITDNKKNWFEQQFTNFQTSEQSLKTILKRLAPSCVSFGIDLTEIKEIADSCQQLHKQLEKERKKENINWDSLSHSVSSLEKKVETVFTKHLPKIFYQLYDQGIKKCVSLSQPISSYMNTGGDKEVIDDIRQKVQTIGRSFESQKHVQNGEVFLSNQALQSKSVPETFFRNLAEIHTISDNLMIFNKLIALWQLEQNGSYDYLLKRAAKACNQSKSKVLELPIDSAQKKENLQNKFEDLAAKIKHVLDKMKVGIYGYMEYSRSELMEARKKYNEIKGTLIEIQNQANDKNAINTCKALIAPMRLKEFADFFEWDSPPPLQEEKINISKFPLNNEQSEFVRNRLTYLKYFEFSKDKDNQYFNLLVHAYQDFYGMKDNKSTKEEIKTTLDNLHEETQAFRRDLDNYLSVGDPLMQQIEKILKTYMELESKAALSVRKPRLRKFTKFFGLALPSDTSLQVSPAELRTPSPTPSSQLGNLNLNDNAFSSSTNNFLHPDFANKKANFPFSSIATPQRPITSELAQSSNPLEVREKSDTQQQVEERSKHFENCVKGINTIFQRLMPYYGSFGKLIVTYKVVFDQSGCAQQVTNTDTDDVYNYKRITQTLGPCKTFYNIVNQSQEKSEAPWSLLFGSIPQCEAAIDTVFKEQLPEIFSTLVVRGLEKYNGLVNYIKLYSFSEEKQAMISSIDETMKQGYADFTSNQEKYSKQLDEKDNQEEVFKILDNIKKGVYHTTKIISEQREFLRNKLGDLKQHEYSQNKDDSYSNLLGKAHQELYNINYPNSISDDLPIPEADKVKLREKFQKLDQIPIFRNKLKNAFFSVISDELVQELIEIIEAFNIIEKTLAKHGYQSLRKRRTAIETFASFFQLDLPSEMRQPNFPAKSTQKSTDQTNLLSSNSSSTHMKESSSSPFMEVTKDPNVVAMELTLEKDDNFEFLRGKLGELKQYKDNSNYEYYKLLTKTNTAFYTIKKSMNKSPLFSEGTKKEFQKHFSQLEEIKNLNAELNNWEQDSPIPDHVVKRTIPIIKACEDIELILANLRRENGLHSSSAYNYRSLSLRGMDAFYKCFGINSNPDTNPQVSPADLPPRTPSPTPSSQLERLNLNAKAFSSTSATSENLLSPNSVPDDTRNSRKRRSSEDLRHRSPSPGERELLKWEMKQSCWNATSKEVTSVINSLINSPTKMAYEEYYQKVSKLLTENSRSQLDSHEDILAYLKAIKQNVEAIPETVPSYGMQMQVRDEPLSQLLKHVETLLKKYDNDQSSS